MRFNIRIDPVWRWALWPGGATSQNSYVMLGDDGMHFRFGLLFNRTVGYDLVSAVFPRSWPLLYGIGWRTNFRGVLGLVGSYHDVVEVRLKKRIRNWAAVFPVDRIAVSLEEPELFIEEVSRRTGLTEPPDINKLSRPTRRPVKRTADSGQPTAGTAAPRKAPATKAASPSAKANGAKPPIRPKAAPRKRTGGIAARARRPRPGRS